MYFSYKFQFIWCSLRIGIFHLQFNIFLYINETKLQEIIDPSISWGYSSFPFQMDAIVNEQWIQVQHLEQALHITRVYTVYFLVYIFWETLPGLHHFFLAFYLFSFSSLVYVQRWGL